MTKKNRFSILGNRNRLSPRSNQNRLQNLQVFDILPNLLDIIQPNLRPVNTQLYSAREKEELKALVDTMTAYNLTYVQERTQEGQYVYK